MKLNMRTITVPLLALIAGLLGVTLAECRSDSSTGAPEAAATAAAAATVAADSAAEGGVIEYQGTPDLMGLVPAKPVVVDFNANWCGPCRLFAPVFDAAARKYAGKADFYSVNVDNFRPTAMAYGVSSIPCIIVIDTKGELHRAIGLMEEAEFDDFLTRSLR